MPDGARCLGRRDEGAYGRGNDVSEAASSSQGTVLAPPAVGPKSPGHPIGSRRSEPWRSKGASELADGHRELDRTSVPARFALDVVSKLAGGSVGAKEADQLLFFCLIDIEAPAIILD